MNICFVALSFGVNGQQVSGVGSQVRILAHSLLAAGHSVRVITLGQCDEITNDEGIQVHQVTSGNLHWYMSKLPLIGKFLASPLREIEYSLAAWKGVRRARRDGAIDIIEGTETGMLLLAIFWKRSPTIVRLHGEQYTFHRYTPGLRLTGDVRLTRVLQRIALRRANLLISPSNAHAAEVSSELRARHPQMLVIPNSVNIPKLSTHQGNRNQNLVLFVGRLDRVKGVTVFLKAAALVIEAVPSAQFIVAGTSHPNLPKEEIDAIIRRYSLQDHLQQFGYLSPQQLTILYQSASVCVVPSYYESFGLVALEAMAHGLPVVAARTGGLAEIVEHEVTGLLVACGDAQAFAPAFIEILGDAPVRLRMSEAGRRRAQTHFAPEEITKLNLSAYEHVRATPSILDELESTSTVLNRNISLEQN